MQNTSISHLIQKLLTFGSLFSLLLFTSCEEEGQSVEPSREAELEQRIEQVNKQLQEKADEVADLNKKVSNDSTKLTVFILLIPFALFIGIIIGLRAIKTNTTKK